MKENNKVFYQRIKHILLCIGLALFFVSSAMPSSISYAQRRVKGEWVLPKHYPDGFDGYGRIDRIAQNEVVIDDSMRRFAPDVEFHTPTSEYASNSDFSIGDLVGYLLNSQREIVSLWLIKKGKQ